MIRNCESCFFARRDPADSSHFICFGEPPRMVPVKANKPQSLVIEGLPGARAQIPAEMIFQNMNVRVPITYPGCALWQCRDCYDYRHECEPANAAHTHAVS